MSARPGQLRTGAHKGTARPGTQDEEGDPMGLNDELEKVHNAVRIISGTGTGNVDAAVEYLEDLVVRLRTAEAGLRQAEVLGRRGATIAASAFRTERERCARHLELLAESYPADVFTPTGDSRDAIGGTAMRHAYTNAARALRAGEHVADTV